MPAPKVTFEKFIEVWLEAVEQDQDQHWVAEQCGLGYDAVGDRVRRYNAKFDELDKPRLPKLVTQRAEHDWDWASEQIEQTMKVLEEE